jgi:putative flippase GtrA
MPPLRSVARAVGYFLAVGALAGVLGLGLTTVLRVTGLPDRVVPPVAIATAVAVALAVADVYTPIGRGPQRDEIRDRPRNALLTDVALAGTVAAAVAALLALLGLLVWSPLGHELLVLVVGIGAGYGAFMYRNKEFYIPERAG